MFDWFWEFLYGILKSLFFCVDFMLEIAGMLCGVEPITVNGQNQDLVYYFLTSNTIVSAFEAILVIGFILLFIFTAYSVFRSMGRLGEGKSSIQVCLDSAKTLLYFFLVPAIMTVGIVVVSTVMSSIYDATSMGETSLGGVLFSVSADGAWKGGGNKEEVLNKFINGTYDYTDYGDVESYFKLKKMDYLIGVLSSLAILVLIALSLFNFVERVIGIIFLFLVAPLSMSTAPLDDGARFKMWRDQVINKYLIAYGSLISINIFMLLVDTLQSVYFFDRDKIFLNLLARVAFIIGGAFACHKGSVLAGNLINQGAGSADKAESASVAGGLRGFAGFVAGKTVGKLAHIANMPYRHVEKDIKSMVHRSGSAKRSVLDDMSRQKYAEKLHAASPKTKSVGAQGTPGTAGTAGAAGNAGAAGASSTGKLESILKNTKSFDPNYQKQPTDGGQRQTDKPQTAVTPKETESKQKPTMAETLSGRSQSAVGAAKEQSPQQTASPMNQHLQGKVSGAMKGSAKGKDGKGS